MLLGVNESEPLDWLEHCFCCDISISKMIKKKRERSDLDICYILFTPNLTSLVFLIPGPDVVRGRSLPLIVELNKIGILLHSPCLILMSVLASLFSLTLRNSQIKEISLTKKKKKGNW